MLHGLQNVHCPQVCFVAPKVCIETAQAGRQAAATGPSPKWLVCKLIGQVHLRGASSQCCSKAWPLWLWIQNLEMGWLDPAQERSQLLGGKQRRAELQVAPMSDAGHHRGQKAGLHVAV